VSEKRDHERALFKSFVDLEPEFAGEPLAEWHQSEDEREFPDIVGRSPSGRQIGVELAEWLNEDEIQAAKRSEQIQRAFLDAIGDQGPNPTSHICYVWLHPKKKITKADAEAFRNELFECVLECDRRWPTERFWKTGHRLTGDELARFPTLAKYLDAVKLWPADAGQWAENWITFPARVDFFDAETMLEPLREIVTAKIRRYGASGTGFDELALLVIYNRAAIYNSPADTPLHTYEDAANAIARMIANDKGPFTRVLLYIAPTPGARVVRIA
jgi:hypothetical protein